MQAQHNTKKNDTIDCIKYILNGLFYIMRHHISVLSRGILDFNWRENIINDLRVPNELFNHQNHQAIAPRSPNIPWDHKNAAG